MNFRIIKLFFLLLVLGSVSCKTKEASKPVEEIVEIEAVKQPNIVVLLFDE